MLQRDMSPREPVTPPFAARSAGDHLARGARNTTVPPRFVPAATAAAAARSCTVSAPTEDCARQQRENAALGACLFSATPAADARQCRIMTQPAQFSCIKRMTAPPNAALQKGTTCPIFSSRLFGTGSAFSSRRRVRSSRSPLRCLALCAEYFKLLGRLLRDAGLFSCLSPFRSRQPPRRCLPVFQAPASAFAPAAAKPRTARAARRCVPFRWSAA
jgi:hypothetical protein